jgi:hypothetical protein
MSRFRVAPYLAGRAFSSEPVRVKKTRENKNLEPGFDKIKTE